MNLDTAKLTVNRALAQTKRKKGEEGDRVVLKNPKTFLSRRTIEIPKVAVEALLRHRLKQKDLRLAAGPSWKEQDYVFTSRIGTPLDSCNVLHRLRIILEEQNLPENPLLRPAPHACFFADRRRRPCKKDRRAPGPRLDQAHHGHLRAPVRRERSGVGRAHGPHFFRSGPGHRTSKLIGFIGLHRVT